MGNILQVQGRKDMGTKYAPTLPKVKLRFDQGNYIYMVTMVTLSAM